MRRVLALEFLGRVDRLLGLLASVVDINEIELGLTRLRAERIARLERREVLARAREVRRIHGVEALLVEQLGALILDLVAAVATERGRSHGEQQGEFADSKHHALSGWVMAAQ